jgi:hypothetical protein
MYLHIGNDHMVKSCDVVGIFDIERTSASRDTRDFLRSSGKKKQDISCTDDIPRSFIVSFEKKNLDEKVYISRLSPSTLKKRWEDY